MPAGFRETTALRDLNLPLVARFAPDGRVFVAEKSGLVKVFDSLADTTPTTFADLRTNVHNFHDRGLLGLALDPGFPEQPYVYVLYTHDAAIGGTAPRWGMPNATSDGCPTPPGETADGCVVSGRLSRLTAAGNVMAGPEKVLVEDWCNQYPSHGMGSIAFDADGRLVVSGGDGASFTFLDYGQDGDPLNPCGDPPGGVGATLTPPTAEGGSLRSQDARTPGDPTALNGALIRVDPATGAGVPDNPFASSGDANLRRIVAYGLRNPFRITVRPGTNEIWAADVGLNQYEEIDRVPTPTVAQNFGWPCYEGAFRQPAWASAGLNICKNLYAQPGAETKPWLAYSASAKVVPGEGCPAGAGSSLSGIAFYPGGPYPDAYDGALFFADFSRNCVWVVKRAGGSLPSPTSVATFVDGASYPVDLVVAPNGELFYVGIGFGTLQRIEYEPGNGTPVAVANATPRAGPTPLAVHFDSAGSHDPDAADAIALAWDLDGDGEYDDSTAAAPSFTYVAAGPHTASLQVTDNHGASSRASVTVVAGDTAPRAEITSPVAGTTWKVGDTIAFAGRATDAEQGTLPAEGLKWSVRMHHCAPAGCHVHSIQDFEGAASGSFVAADHEYPAHLELVLTATDAQGVSDTASVRLDPKTATLTMRTNAAGLQLVVDGSVATTPFVKTVIQGSTHSVSAPSPQTVSGRTWEFLAWLDLGARTHNVTVASNTALAALYLCTKPSLLCTLVG